MKKMILKFQNWKIKKQHVKFVKCVTNNRTRINIVCGK